uniref:Uncharacterized protein n=1 Tax=viral metagenome TaxID=1070528 RepID=A0A6M3L2P1_9ZZZZ
MICPMKVSINQDRGYLEYECVVECAWYDNAKQQCCIKTISQLKKIIVSGGINTHTY